MLSEILRVLQCIPFIFIPAYGQSNAELYLYSPQLWLLRLMVVIIKWLLIQQILNFSMIRKSFLRNIVSKVYQFIVIVKRFDGVTFL